MSRVCPVCYDDIPDEMHGSARYCSNECSYSARLERSKLRYAKMKNITTLVDKNEKILDQYFPFMAKKVSITIDMLSVHDFDFDFTQRIRIDSKNRKWITVGKYYYFIDEKKEIWILKT